MFIPEFWAGVFITLGVEALVLLALSMASVWRKK